MVPAESPVVARRRVRLVLRERREAQQLTQSDVAEAMEWSLSKVIRIESGEVSISPNDLRPLLNHLGVRDRALVASLLADAKASRSRHRRWWQEPRFKEFLTPAMARLIEFELEARAFRYFSLFMVPGALQTESFARAVLNKWHEDLPPEKIDARLEARMRRRENLLNATQDSQISVLLDEAVLLRAMGGAQVFREQLEDLLRLVRTDRIQLRILPFTIDAPPPLYGSYDLVYLGEDGDDDNAIIYRETHLADEIVEDRMQAALHRARFETLWKAAKEQDATSALIRKRLVELGAADASTDNP